MDFNCIVYSLRFDAVEVILVGHVPRFLVSPLKCLRIEISDNSFVG